MVRVQNYIDSSVLSLMVFWLSLKSMTKIADKYRLNYEYFLISGVRYISLTPNTVNYLPITESNIRFESGILDVRSTNLFVVLYYTNSGLVVFMSNIYILTYLRMISKLNFKITCQVGNLKNLV